MVVAAASMALTRWYTPMAGSPRERWRASDGAFRSYVLVASLLVAEGSAMLIGGPSRTSGNAYTAVNALSGGQGPQVFATIVLACGLILAVFPARPPVVVRTALMVAAVAHLLLATGWTWSLIQDRRGGLLGPIAFVIIAAWMLSQRELYRRAPR